MDSGPRSWSRTHFCTAFLQIDETIWISLGIMIKKTMSIIVVYVCRSTACLWEILKHVDGYQWYSRTVFNIHLCHIKHLKKFRLMDVALFTLLTSINQNVAGGKTNGRKRVRWHIGKSHEGQAPLICHFLDYMIYLLWQDRLINHTLESNSLLFAVRVRYFKREKQ